MFKIDKLVMSVRGLFSKQREKIMSKQDRKKHVRNVVEDFVVDGLEDAVFKNKITRHEANKVYNMFASRYELRDLKVPEPSPMPDTIKEYIKSSIQLLKKTRMNGGIFTRLRTVKVDHNKELKAHNRLLSAILADAEEIEKGRLRVKKLNKTNPTAMQRSTQHGNSGPEVSDDNTR